MSPESATHYTSVQLIDLHSWKVRKEYTPAGVDIFLNIMEKWNVSPEDARLLLSGISNRYYRLLKSRPQGRILSTDRLYRISYQIGIYKALHIAYGDKLADEFVHMPNANRLFGGTTPLSFMIAGGQPAMQEVRRLLDARAAGNW
jgi:hypothetical protein